MATSYCGRDLQGRKKTFASEEERQMHAKTKALAEKRVKKVLKKYQAKVPEANVDGLADSAARLACSICEMTVDYDKCLGALADDDEQGYQTLVARQSKERKQEIQKWKHDPKWGQASGLEQVKNKCIIALTSAFEDAQDLPLDNKEKKELEKIYREWDQEEAAREKERSNEAGPSGNGKGKENVEGGSLLGGGRNESQRAAASRKDGSSKRPRSRDGPEHPPTKKRGGLIVKKRQSTDRPR